MLWHKNRICYRHIQASDGVDIVSEWEEEINEEELEKLAEEEYPYEYSTSLYGNGECEYKNDLREAFKAGYRISRRLLR